MESITRDWLANWLMVFLRTGGLLAVFPMFSARNMPIQVRTALGAFTALLLAPALPPPTIQPDNLWSLVGVMAAEVGIGLILGFLCRLIFFGLEVAGGIIGTEMGLSLPPAFDPISNSQSTAPGAVLYYLAIVLWLGLDLHHWLLAAFQRAYTFLPVGGGVLREAVLTEILSRCVQLFTIALQIAAPILAVSFIISLIFSVLGRTVPQMNVFSESFSIRILAGLTVFGLTCQLMAQHILNYLNRLPDDLLLIARLLAR